MEPINQYITTGKLEDSVFYRINLPWDECVAWCFESEARHQGLICQVRFPWDSNRLWVETNCEIVEARKCPVSPDHVTAVFQNVVSADLWGGVVYGTMIPDAANVGIVVSPDMASAIRKARFSGLTVERLPIVYNGSRLSSPQDPECYILRPAGDDCIRRVKINIPARNACPYCDYEPLVCSVCKDYSVTCPNCGFDLYSGDNERPPLFFRAAIPLRWPIIDGVNWHGQDLLSPKIVSHRMLTWLLEHGAEPIEAVPLLLDVADMTEEQLQLVDLVRG